jgi:putative dimethyl sulfoxide reductase chaperone
MDKILKKQHLSDSLKLLASCFYQPEKKLFEEEKVCQNLHDLFEHFSTEAQSSASCMSAAMQNSSEEELQIAHAQLFVGPFELKASPYGSTYLEKTRRIMGDSTMEVLKHYQKAGLEVDIKQPPDHIAIELEFLSYLCALEAESLHNGDIKKAAELQAEQKLFLDRYILPWAPQFAQNIRSGTKCKFYLCLADCFEFFLKQLATADNSKSMREYADPTTH